MNDPHIDIDDIDQPDLFGGTSGTNQVNENFKGRAKAESAEAGYDMGSMFGNMARQFQRWSSDFSLLPAETTQHLRASQREFLLAWRSVIDHSLERLERQELRDQLRAEANMTGDFGRGVDKIQVEEIDD